MEDATDSLRRRVKALLDGDNYGDAITTARQAIQREPNNPVYYGLLAWAYNAKGDYREAVDVANQAIEIDSSYAAALRQCGYAYIKQEKYVEAIAPLSRAVELEPDDPRALQDRAWSYLRLGRHEDALPDLARGYELEPKQPYRTGDRKKKAYRTEWFQTIHQHFENELLPRVNSSPEERFIEYWPCHVVWDVQVETRWYSGSSLTHYCGSVGTGYLCLTTANVYLASLGPLTRKYNPTKEMGLGGLSTLFAPVKWDVDVQKADELRVVPTRGISSTQVLKRHLAGFVELQSQFGRYLIYPAFLRDDEYISRALTVAAAGLLAQPEQPGDSDAGSTSEGDPMRLLRQLGELRATGILTEEEFETKKKELLARL